MSFGATVAPKHPVRLVCATRLARADFHSRSALGQSLSTHSVEDVQLRLFEQNTRGLPEVYNVAIEESISAPAVLVFVHDDVQLSGSSWVSMVLEGLACFDVVGVAGNKRRVPGQPGWSFVDKSLTWDIKSNLSGTVGYGAGLSPEDFSVYGPSRQAVKLLDGLLLAVESDRLVRSGIRFDQRFRFNFYDLDFCRQCEAGGLSMGTWPIPVVHQSAGSFGGLKWWFEYMRYMKKWGE